MKHESFYEMRESKKLHAKIRLWKGSELAHEFGLTPAQLAQHMRRSRTTDCPAPEPLLVTMHEVRHYDPAAVRAWWKTYSAKRKSLAPQG